MAAGAAVAAVGVGAVSQTAALPALMMRRARLSPATAPQYGIRLAQAQMPCHPLACALGALGLAWAGRTLAARARTAVTEIEGKVLTVCAAPWDGHTHAYLRS